MIEAAEQAMALVEGVASQELGSPGLAPDRRPRCGLLIDTFGLHRALPILTDSAVLVGLAVMTSTATRLVDLTRSPLHV